MYRLSNDTVNMLLKCMIKLCSDELYQNDIDFLVNYLQNIEIDNLINISKKHGVLPIVYKNLQKIDNIPQTVLVELKKQYKKTVYKNLIMSAELITIIKVLEENSIRAISFKGPILSIMLYKDITLRQYGDLDILVEPFLWQKASKVLQQYGYEDILDISDRQKQLWNDKAKEINLYNKQKNIYIDLQRYIFDNDYPLVFNHKLFRQSYRVKINKYNIHTFKPEVLLIYLTIHGSKHLFERVSWVKDIDMLIRTQDIDWILVDDLIGKAKDFQRMFLLGIYLSYVYFETDIPHRYINKFQKNKWLINIHDFIYINWYQKQNFIVNTLYMIKLFPTLKQKLLYINKVIFKPSKNEYRLIDLPYSLYWVYPILRIGLLIKKYTFKYLYHS